MRKLDSYFNRLIECSGAWWKWFFISLFCEPVALFYVGRRMKLSLPIYRFLIFGFLLLGFRVLLNLKSDTLLNELEEQQPNFENMEHIESGKKLFFEPKDLQIAELSIDRKDIKADLINQLNRLVAGLSCFLVLYTIWTIQRILVRWKYDQMRSADTQCWQSCLMAIICAKCSNAQMAVTLEDNQTDENII